METFNCTRIFICLILFLESILSILVIAGSVILTVLSAELFILVVSAPCLFLALVNLFITIYGLVLIGKSVKWVKKAFFRVRRKKIYSTLIFIEILLLILHFVGIGLVAGYTIKVVAWENRSVNSTQFEVKNLELETVSELSNLGGIGGVLLVWFILKIIIILSLCYWLKIINKNKDLMFGMNKLEYSIKNYKDLVEDTDIDVDMDSVDMDREEWEDSFTNDEIRNGSQRVQDEYACNVKAI